MTQLATATRAVPYVATEYAAFRIADMGKGFKQRTYAIELKGYPSSLDEAANAALSAQAFAHKDHLLIRETGEKGVTLHLFAVKRKSAGRPVYRDYVTRTVHDLYLAPVVMIDGGVLGAGL